MKYLLAWCFVANCQTHSGMAIFATLEQCNLAKQQILIMETGKGFVECTAMEA